MQVSVKSPLQLHGKRVLFLLAALTLRSQGVGLPVGCTVEHPVRVPVSVQEGGGQGAHGRRLFFLLFRL